jgi:hypothetical protein
MNLESTWVAAILSSVCIAACSSDDGDAAATNDDGVEAGSNKADDNGDDDDGDDDDGAAAGGADDSASTQDDVSDPAADDAMLDDDRAIGDDSTRDDRAIGDDSTRDDVIDGGLPDPIEAGPPDAAGGSDDQTTDDQTTDDQTTDDQTTDDQTTDDQTTDDQTTDDQTTDDAGGADDAGSSDVHRGAEFVTLVGGSRPSGSGRDVAVGPDGSIFVTGGIRSNNSGFVTTIGPDTYDGNDNDGDGQYNMDVLVAKFSPNGNLLFSRVLGGPQYDRAYSIEVDASGDVYVGGRAGAGFVTTAGTVQPDFADDQDPSNLYGRQDGFVTKLDGDDGSIIWSTYFGTPGHDVMRDIAVTSGGDVYISQEATRQSPHITNVGVLDSSKPFDVGQDKEDIILAKITGDGTNVEFAGWWGGNDRDRNPVIRIASNGDLVLLMGTTSTNLPISQSPAPVQADFGGGTSDLYVARFSGDASELDFATYYGGNGWEGVETHQLALTPSDQPLVVSSTTSTDLPVTLGSNSLNGDSDIHIAILAADGSSVVASRLFGGNGSDGAEGVSVDGTGRVVMGGGTNSTDFPTTAGAHQTTFGGGNYDGIVLALSADLATTLLSTYVGGDGDFDSMRSSAFDEENNAVVLFGQNDSSDFPTTPGAHQVTTTGPGDAALVRFLLP